MGTKILSLAQLKGGCGKTTISSHVAGTLSGRGFKVAAIDGDDPQYSLTNWFNAGYEKPNLELAKVSNAEQLIQAINHYDGKVDYIVIDLAPRLKDITRAGIAVSDVTVVPVNTDLIEIWALNQTIELMTEAKEKIPNFRYFVMTNKYQAHNENHQAMRQGIADQFNCELLENSLGQRKAFPDAVGHGVTISDLNPKTPKAIAEMDALINEIISKLDQ
ncbi:AAA family ATPase [Acinetobacter oleivorans]|uniref:ParA family protein n=1 Tax=Acinetobacter TaxID=469 RepID=UPI001580ED09|nr:ParA family protein [Acinetobacter pittii]NUF45016.1 ParA family protein [Acinetobacter pittii]